MKIFKKIAVSSASNLENAKILNRVRLIAINGQVALIIIAYFYFQIHLPIAEITILLSLEIGFQIFSYWRCQHKGAIKSFELLFHFIFDSILLAALVYFTGGPNNPFIYLLLLPLALGTLMLSPRSLLLVAVLQLVLYSLLNLFQQHLHLSHDSPLASFHLHLAGMWVNFGLTVILIAIFGIITRLSTIKQEKKIQQLREKQIRDEQLLSLGIMSASAAHELGTPLSTMAIITDDLIHDPSLNEVIEDLELLNKQIKKCRSIIDTLAEKSRQVKGSLQQTQSVTSKKNLVRPKLKQVFEDWLVYRPQIKLLENWHESINSTYYDVTISLEQSLTNLLNNAADASLDNKNDTILVKCNRDQDWLRIDIVDFGKGLTEELRKSLGESLQTSNKKDGMGWGLFLTNASIDRVGGKVELLESAESEEGTITRVTLPLTNDGNKHG